MAITKKNRCAKARSLFIVQGMSSYIDMTGASKLRQNCLSFCISGCQVNEDLSLCYMHHSLEFMENAPCRHRAINLELLLPHNLIYNSYKTYISRRERRERLHRLPEINEIQSSQLIQSKPRL